MRRGWVSIGAAAARCQPGPRLATRDGLVRTASAKGSACSVQCARHSDAPPVSVSAGGAESRKGGAGVVVTWNK
eukprot:gene7808-7875_t